MTLSIHIVRIPNDWVVTPSYTVHAKNFRGDHGGRRRNPVCRVPIRHVHAMLRVDRLFAACISDLANLSPVLGA